MEQELLYIKEQLFDAPSEVKQSFNNLVEYFAIGGYIKGAFGEIRRKAQIASLKQDIEKLEDKKAKIKADKINPAKEEISKIQSQIDEKKEKLNKLKEG